MLTEFDDILTVQDVATILMVGKNTVYSLLESNTLKGFRIGRTWKVPKEALIDYIRQATGLRF